MESRANITPKAEKEKKDEPSRNEAEGPSSKTEETTPPQFEKESLK